MPKKEKVKTAIKLKIRKGDKVVVIAGKDKGKTGEVLKALPMDNRVIVAGVNVVKKHTRQSATSAGGVVTKELSIHVSNVALADPKDGKPTRAGFKILNDGTKTRIAKKSGEDIVAQ